jgi:hypothetical protein
VILKARDTWPRTAKVYCHRVEDWPDEPDVVERVLVRSCVRRGAAIELVLDRARENRSQLVMTTIHGGRQAIFWQTARTTKQARPRVNMPTARAAGVPDLKIVVDSRERYAYTFSDRPVTVTKAALPAGDYGVLRDGALLAAVERKSLADLVTSLTTGKLNYQLAELATFPRAALVVEDRYSEVYKLEHVRPAVVADGIAESRSGGRMCRSCSARPVSSPRSGPTAFSPPRRSQRAWRSAATRSSPASPAPSRCPSVSRPRPRYGPGLSSTGTTSATAAGSRARSSTPTAPHTPVDPVAGT